MKLKIGVMGSGKDTSKDQEKLAQAVGKEIAAQNCILITGGCGGLPYEAASAAAAQGGLCLGFSPAATLSDHVEREGFPTSPYVLVFTGMGKKGRNVVSVRTCDAVIFIGGRMGTLNEFTIAYDEDKVIGILEDSGGLSNTFYSLAEQSGKVTKAIIIREKDPVKLVQEVIRKLREV